MSQINKVDAAVAVATIDEVLRVNVNSAKTLGLEVKNSGLNPLDAFDVYGKMSDSGAEFLLLTSAANFTTPVYPCIRASASPVTLASGATEWLFLDVSALSEIIFKASSSTGSTKLDFHGSNKFNA